MMYGLLAVLGIGFLVSGLVGSSDDGGTTEDVGPDGDGSTPESFTNGLDVILDQSYLPAVQADAADLVAEGELTQAEADAALAAVEFRSGSVNIDTRAGGDYVVTGNGADTIATGEGDDLAIGGAGDDRIDLGNGSDVYGIEGRAIESEDDFIAFPDGDFDLFGPASRLEAGDDTVLGGAGNDAISDSFGSNYVNGQQGNDFIVVVDEEAGAPTPDGVNGGFGNDTIYVDEGDRVTGNQGRDQIIVDVFNGVAAGYDVVTITDFDPARDSLELEGSFGLLLPATPTGPGDVPVNPISVADMADGSGAIVSINGIAVVHVIGGAGMTVANVGIST